MAEFVTIKPGVRPDGTPHRVPMPSGYGLPGFGALLPADGFRVPRDHFVSRLLADGDAVEVEPPAAPAARSKGAANSSTESAP